MSPDNTWPIDALLTVFSISKPEWMAENFLQLNQDKTEVLVIGPDAMREKHLSELQALSSN